MAFVVIKHRVANFAKWKQVFDDRAENRRRYGLDSGWVTHSRADPNEVVVILRCLDLTRAQEFFQSDELHRDMKQAGVIEAPELYFLEEVEAIPELEHAGAAGAA